MEGSIRRRNLLSAFILAAGLVVCVLSGVALCLVLVAGLVFAGDLVRGDYDDLAAFGLIGLIVASGFASSLLAMQGIVSGTGTRWRWPIAFAGVALFGAVGIALTEPGASLTGPPGPAVSVALAYAAWALLVALAPRATGPSSGPGRRSIHEQGRRSPTAAPHSPVSEYRPSTGSGPA